MDEAQSGPEPDVPSKPVLATPDFRVHPDIAQVGIHWKIGPCDLVSDRA